MLSMAFSMMTNRQKQKFKETAELIGLWRCGPGPFPCQRFQQRGQRRYGAARHSSKIRTTEELNLPPVISKICEEQRGLVLVTGTTGSGKSTTLAAMIDRINATAPHLITIEDPIEFLHRDKKSFIHAARRAMQWRNRCVHHSTLALIDGALLVAVQELDGVFDGDQMVGAVGIDAVDHPRPASWTYQNPWFPNQQPTPAAFANLEITGGGFSSSVVRIS